MAQKTLQISEWSEVEIGKQVQTVVDGKAYLGTVRFSGKTQFAKGHWIGLELDEPVGKNDGSVQGVPYFSCPARHGLFCRPSITPTSSPAESANQQTGGLAEIKENIKEILGHMKDLCVQHQMLKSEVARLDQVERLAADADVKHQRQAEAPVVLSAPKRSEEADHWVGERVQVKMKTGMCCGTVRFNGTTHSGGHRIGVELDEPVGKNDGSVKEHRYFTCAAKHGVFLHPKDIFSESDPGSSVLEVRHIIKELLTKADGVSDKQAATIAKVHELMSQVEHLDDTVEHVAIRRKQLAEVEQSGDMYNGEVDSKVATLARRVKDPNATLEFSALPKREPQLVDPEAGPSTTGCPAARAARSRFCFDESSRPFGPDATDDGDVSPYARSPSRPSPYGRLSDPFVPDLSSNSRAASETLLPDSTAPDGLLDPLEPVRGRLSDPVVLDLSSDSRASDTRYLPDDEFGVRLILPP